MIDTGLTNQLHPSRIWAIRANRFVYSISKNWIGGFSLVYGLFVLLPFLAPTFMELGWNIPGRWIYMVYSFLCHQLPQRSFFLFGNSFTYPISNILAVWPSDSIGVLRQFIGSPEMGWKVAWSDRMVSMYTSTLILAWVWYPIRKRLPRLSLIGFLLFLLPMAVDGFSHLFSELSGIGQGFRDTNLWLAQLTRFTFPQTFYAGDAWGSFNSIMRLISGILFAIGVVWFAFPHLDELFTDIKEQILWKFHKAGLSI